MLIVAVDTSGKSGGLALVSFAADRTAVLEIVPLTGGSFSAELVPQIAGLLSRHQLAKSDIEGLAVVSGPGSFTGLRVGLAAVKALGEVLSIPIATVSILQALAFSAGAEGRILALTDAGRQELCAGFYEVDGDGALLLGEQLLSPEELKLLTGAHLVVTADPKLAARLEAWGVIPRLIPYPQADVVARLGFNKLQSGEIVSPDALDATYYRPSDMEIKKPSRNVG